MNIIETVQADLKGASTARQREVAVKMGVPFGTLRKIVMGQTKNPGYGHVQRMMAYYQDNPLVERVDAP